MWKKLFGPKTPEDYEAKMVGALQRGDPEKALTLADEAVSRFPAVSATHLARAKALAILGRVDDAIAATETLLESNPVAVWLQRARILARADRSEESFDAYLKATQADPTSAEAWLQWGGALATEAHHGAALSKFDQALALDNANPETQFERARILSRLWRFEEALTGYEVARRLNHDAAAAAIRSTLLYLGRVEEANGGARSRDDTHGEARERKMKVGERVLVARYFVGSHSNPELLDSVVEAILEKTADLKDAHPGLSDGTTILVDWPVLTLREFGGELVLCEPDWNQAPASQVRPQVTFSAMQLVMTRIVSNLVKAEPVACSCHLDVTIERGALEAKRIVMYRDDPKDDRDSGWFVRCTVGDDFEAARVPLTALAVERPHLCKVTTLPFGWNVQMHGIEIARVVDPEGNIRLDTTG